MKQAKGAVINGAVAKNNRVKRKKKKMALAGCEKRNCATAPATARATFVYTRLFLVTQVADVNVSCFYLEK